MDDSDALKVRPLRWGEIVQLPSGHWQTTWTIQLESLNEEQVEEVAVAANDAEAGFVVAIHVHDRTMLEVVVETTLRALDDAYHGLTYRLFRLIDSRLGRIDLLQGSPRDWWPPFISSNA